jgi:hypothetical protein
LERKDELLILNHKSASLGGRIMRALLLILAILVSSAASADIVSIVASQDNTIFDDGNGTLSNGSGNHIFAGRTANQAIRRGLIAFKDLSAIPDGATIESVRLHLRMNRQASAATNVNLLRLNSDWGEGASDAAGQEGRGIQAQSGDATWIHTFFDQSTWNTQGGDFAEVASAQRMINDVGDYTFGSTNAMVNDVQDWLDNPGSNFGWILIANENATSARRFSSRENGSAGDRPTLEIEYSVASDTILVGDISGIWFDTLLDGEGYNVYKTPVGYLIYFFGYSASQNFLWITSDLVVIEEWVVGQDYEFPMFIGVPGTFDNPTPATELQPYGLLIVNLNGCGEGTFILDGDDGMKVSNTIKLVGVDDTSCTEVTP